MCALLGGEMSSGEITRGRGLCLKGSRHEGRGEASLIIGHVG